VLVRAPHLKWPASAGPKPHAHCSQLRSGRGDCSHSVVVDAAPWGEDVRLSDIEPRFTYNAAPPPVNSAQAELLTIRILIATEHSSIQALTEFHFRFGANR
jgi:hypothetical protein